MKRNRYPRPGADLSKTPREVCVHDPSGLLASCDVCGVRAMSAGVLVVDSDWHLGAVRD